MLDLYLSSLVCPLPEDIAHLKGAGEFDLALALIEERLAGDLPSMLRQRLEAEKYLLPQLANAYTLTHEQLLLAMRQRVKSFTDQELEELLSRGLLDFIYVNGTRYYHEDTVGSLLKSQHALNLRANPAYDEDRAKLDGVIRRMMAHDLTFRYRLRATTLVRTLEPDTLYRVHMCNPPSCWWAATPRTRPSARPIWKAPCAPRRNSPRNTPSPSIPGT